MKKPLMLPLVLLVSLGACGGGGDDPAATGPHVQMVNGQSFDPGELTVTVGDAVAWTNESSEAHTVTAYEGDVSSGDYFASGGFTSEEDARSDLSAGLIDPGETFEATFDEPGTYKYFCIPHEGAGMKGTIVVEP